MFETLLMVVWRDGVGKGIWAVRPKNVKGNLMGSLSNGCEVEFGLKLYVDHTQMTPSHPIFTAEVRMVIARDRVND
jgi:hypothetical protein